MGWGGQAIQENTGYRVPWFGRNTKFPRARKPDCKGRGNGDKLQPAQGAYPSSYSRAPPNEGVTSAEELLAFIQKLPRKDPLPEKAFRALYHFDSRAVALLLKDLSRVGMDKRAIELFDYLRALDENHVLRPLCDVYTFTAMVSMCIHQQNVDRAMELVEDMRQRNIERNVHTYTALMNVCIKCGRLPLALDIYNSMRSMHCMPNVVTYNTLVDVYGKLGHWEKAVQVVASMKSEGVEPVLRTYNTLIIACNMCNQPREALNVCSRLLADGFIPNSTTYNALISAYGKVGQLDKALDIYQKMLHQNMERSVITYSSVISACEKAGQWETALRIFDEMQMDGCAPNTVTYNSLITACAQGSQWEKASNVFEQMTNQGCTPDVVTYTALISAFERGGQWQKALQAFHKMCVQGCKPDVIVYNAIIDTMWETGIAWAQSKALQLYSTAVQQGHFRHEPIIGKSGRVELNLHAMTAGVAMLSLYTWMREIQVAVRDHGPQALPNSLMIVTDMGRSSKEQGNCIVKEAVTAMMSFWQAPFKPTQNPMYSAALEASGVLVGDWVRGPNVNALLCSLFPVSDSDIFGEESVANREHQVLQECNAAFAAVQMFEQTHGLILDNMCPKYVQERASLVSHILDVSNKLGLRDEIVHDAVLLMDRTASEAQQVPQDVLPLLGIAALSAASKRRDSGSNASAPSTLQLELASEVPATAITSVEWNIRSLLHDDLAAISTMRCLKIYLERLGLRFLGQQGVYGLAGYAIMMSVEALYDLSLLNCRPSVVAAALVYAERRLRGLVPFWPSILAKMTGYEDMSSPELTVAVRLAQKLARKSVYAQIYSIQMVALSPGMEAAANQHEQVTQMVQAQGAGSLRIPKQQHAAQGLGWDAGFEQPALPVGASAMSLLCAPHGASAAQSSMQAAPAVFSQLMPMPLGHGRALEQQHPMMPASKSVLASLNSLGNVMQSLAEGRPSSAFPADAIARNDPDGSMAPGSSTRSDQARDLSLVFSQLGM